MPSHKVRRMRHSRAAPFRNCIRKEFFEKGGPDRAVSELVNCNYQGFFYRGLPYLPHRRTCRHGIMTLLACWLAMPPKRERFKVRGKVFQAPPKRLLGDKHLRHDRPRKISSAHSIKSRADRSDSANEWLAIWLVAYRSQKSGADRGPVVWSDHPSRADSLHR